MHFLSSCPSMPRAWKATSATVTATRGVSDTRRAHAFTEGLDSLSSLKRYCLNCCPPPPPLLLPSLHPLPAPCLDHFYLLPSRASSSTPHFSPSRLRTLPCTARHHSLLKTIGEYSKSRFNTRGSKYYKTQKRWACNIRVASHASGSPLELL